MKNINLGNNLYSLRKKSGLSQEEFAEKLHISRQAVSKWERGEAFPDTENLIEIAEFYGVTIDELVKGTVSSDGGCADEDAPHESEEEKDGKEKRVIINLGGLSVTVDKDGAKEKVSVSTDGIEVFDGEDGERISIGTDGIKIVSDKKKKHGVSVNTNLHFDLKNLPYVLIVTVAYLLLGFLVPDGWAVWWTLFITIPVYYTLVTCIKVKRFSPFAYPVLCAFVYCLCGMLTSVWHPTWIIFLSIPFYYWIAYEIDKVIARKRGESVFVPDDDDDDDDEDDDE